MWLSDFYLPQQVSICAAAPSRCIMWRRSALEYILVKEPDLAQAMSVLIAHDISTKLAGLTRGLRWGGVLDAGAVDLRLPSIAGKIGRMDQREHSLFRTTNSKASQHP